MLSTTEAAAHVRIIGTIANVQDNVISEQRAYYELCRPLEAFRPRCNCGRVLQWSPWIDGIRAARCRCGVWFRECR